MVRLSLAVPEFLDAPGLIVDRFAEQEVSLQASLRRRPARFVGKPGLVSELAGGSLHTS